MSGSASSASAYQVRQHPASLSPTALRAYDQCPRSYEFAYVDRSGARADEPASAHLVFGNALHQALAFLFRLPVEERDVTIAQRALRHYWARQPKRKEAFLTEAEEVNWGLSALEAIEVFCRERADELHLEPLAVEEWVRAPLDNGFAVGGKVDRVERIHIPPPPGGAEGEALHGLRVTDYKTGKCRFASGDELAEDRGAQVYALATSRTLREPVLEVRFLYLRENLAVTWQVERDDLEQLEDELSQRVGEIVADEDFEPRPDFYCRWCHYRHLCPEGSGQASADELDQEPETVF